MSSRLPSDVGGTGLGRRIDRRDPGHADWELLAAGVRMALIARGLFRWDEGRRAVEALGHERYRRLGYEARKLAAVEALLVEKEALARAELPPGSQAVPLAAAERRRIASAARRRGGSPDPAGPSFGAGDAVRVRDDRPPGHVRTPAYLRGKPGRVAGVHGPFGNPETLAYGESGRPAQWLYMVEFRQADVWSDYGGPAADLLRADIYEHWLEPREAAT